MTSSLRYGFFLTHKRVSGLVKQNATVPMFEREKGCASEFLISYMYEINIVHDPSD